MTSSSPKVGLALGSGGVLGGAFHAGVLKALLDVRGIDAREASVLVGTSAGAITGALLGAGLHPNDIYRRETNQPLSPAGQRIFGRVRSQLGRRAETQSAMGWPVAPGVAMRAAFDPLNVAPGTVMAGLLPRGTVSTDRIRHLVDGMLADRPEGVWAWPGDPFIQICAVDMTTGRRRVFDGTAGESFGEAVAASCAVPGVFEPVEIAGTTFLDGGVHSSDNVDVLAAHDLDQVVVSSPMSTERLYDVRSVWHPLRMITRAQTDREVGSLGSGVAVDVIRPSRDDLDAMGPNLLDGQQRAAVALQAYTTAAERLSR